MSPQRMPLPLASQAGQSAFAKIGHDICLVATDMDGTLTEKGTFTAALLTALEALKARGLKVMVVTGRSAGWVSAVVNYLPIVGAIAENGGLYISKTNPAPLLLPDIPQISQHRDRLAELFRTLQTRYPHLKASVDNPFRLTDWTFDIDGLSAEDIAWMQAICAEQSMGFTYSTVQCHLKLAHQNKAAGLTQVLRQCFPHVEAAAVLTVGDSPNDESLFDRAQFPHSVGVANVAHYLSSLAHTPTYMTASPEGTGFTELVKQLLAPSTDSSTPVSLTPPLAE